MRLQLLSSAAVVATILAPAPVSAQDIVMRRAIPKSQSVQGGARWLSTPWVIYDGSGNAVNAGDACGDYVERRTTTCVDGSDAQIDEMFCRGTPKPALERQARHDAGCTYAWRTGVRWIRRMPAGQPSVPVSRCLV